MLLWTKIKQKNLQICICNALLAYIFEKRCTQEGVQSLYVFFHNHNYLGDASKFMYKALILDYKQFLSRSRRHTSTPPETSFSQIARYFAQTSQPFFALLLQLAILLYEGSTFEQKLKVARNTDFYLSGRGFKYIILR